MSSEKTKNNFLFVVSDVGGVPILSIPEVPSDELNILTIMTSVLDSLASVAYGDDFFVGSVDTSNRRLIYIKKKNLVFMLLLPRKVDSDVASSTLKELAEKFVELFGDDPDDIRGVLLFRTETLNSFQRDVVNMLMDIIRELAPEHLGAFLEELFALLKSRGIDVSRVESKFEPVSVPYIINDNMRKKVKDDLDRRILELCDGKKTAREIADALDVSPAEVYERLAKLQKKGIIGWKIAYRLKR